MKRAPIVLGATAVGLAAVLGFHTSATPITLGSLGTASSSSGSGTSGSTTSASGSTTGSVSSSGSGSSGSGTSSSTGTATTTPATTVPTTSRPTSSATAGSGTAATTPTTTSPPTTTAPATTTRTAVGAQVNYYFGVLSVSVTAQGHKITKVGIGTLSDGGNYRSQSIDQQSIPLLEQQALTAQSANIQGVAGASYTSAGFQQSLQSALKKLGI